MVSKAEPKKPDCYGRDYPGLHECNFCEHRRECRGSAWRRIGEQDRKERGCGQG